MVMKKIMMTFVILTATLSTAAQTGTDSLELDSMVRNLPEVMVKARRPAVKTEPGKLVFDMNVLLKDKPADNAYDALKQLPGVSESNGALTLNRRSVTLILDGKVSTMTAEQLAELLKTIPKDRMAKCEMMMSAPARYQVRGQAINIVLRHGSGLNGVQAETFGAYRQKHYAQYEERATLLYNSGKFEIDALYSCRHGREHEQHDSHYLHMLNDGSTHPLSMFDDTQSRSRRHNFRLGMNWNFTANNRLSLVYTGNYSTSRARQDVNGSVNSMNRWNSKPLLHNLRLDWQTPWGMKTGVETTYYRSPETQTLTSKINGEQLNFITDNAQRINRWRAYLAQEHTLANGWGLNYGATATTSLDNSRQTYLPTAGNTATTPGDAYSRQREATLNLYAGTTKSFGEKMSLDFSLAAEYYHSPVWNGWDIFPNLNLTYTPAEGHTLILSLDCDRNYPSYWAVNNFTSYSSGGYGLIVGNPNLKPSRDYEASLAYVLMGKYMLTTWFNYSRDYFVQVAYQRPDTLLTQYKNLNAVFQQQAGVQLSVPFTPARWLDSRLSLNGVWQKELNKEFYNIPYNRSRFFILAQMTATFTLCKPLTLTLDGTYHSKAIQGPMDIKPAGSLNAALRFKLFNDRLLLTAYCNDILKSDRQRFTDTWHGQNISMNITNWREFGMTLTLRLNNYKERKREAVDTSRFK